MKRKNILIIIIFILSFIIVKPVKAEEQKVYWIAGSIERTLPNLLLENGIDLSQNNDNSVIMGTKNNILYIQYEGKLVLNQDSYPNIWMGKQI